MSADGPHAAREADPARAGRPSCAQATPRAGRALRLALLVAGVALAVFGAIAVDVMTGGVLARVDHQVAAVLPERAGPGLLQFMAGVSALHVTRMTMAATALLALLLLWTRARRAAALLLLAVPPGALLNDLLKHAFQRPRPEAHEGLARLLSFGFPSGHTAQATLLYGALCLVCLPRLSSPAARFGLVAAACAMVLLVGASRIVLGAHYASDVLAAMAEGIAWLALCVAAVEAWTRHRAARRSAARSPRP